jgi:glycine/D-amino acid oxidase-like deaminating enzyme
MNARLPLPPSLYADTAVAPVATPPLDVDKTVSVAIIGGGYTGLSTALHLAEQGVEALVLEAQEPGWGASGNNGGHTNPGLKHDPDQIEADFGVELGRRMIDFSYGTTNFTHDLIRRYQIPCEARQNGTLRAAYNEASAAAIETTAQQCISRGMPVSYLNREQLREMTGTDRYIGAMLDTRGGDLHPLSYARGLARAAISAGAKVHGETPALSLRREGSRWRIETPRAVVHADKVLLATNGFTDDL